MVTGASDARWFQISAPFATRPSKDSSSGAKGKLIRIIFNLTRLYWIPIKLIELRVRELCSVYKKIIPLFAFLLKLIFWPGVDTAVTFSTSSSGSPLTSPVQRVAGTAVNTTREKLGITRSVKNPIRLRNADRFFSVNTLTSFHSTNERMKKSCELYRLWIDGHKNILWKIKVDKYLLFIF